MSAGTESGALRRRVLRGLAGYAVTQPISLLIQIASVPLYLHFWGVALYGEWIVVAAIPAYLTTSDLGFTTATQHAMTAQVAAGDRAAALRSFRTSWWVISLISLFVCAVVVLGSHLLPLADWLHLGLLAGNGAQLLSLFVLHVVLSLQTGLLNAGFCAEGEYGQGVTLLGLGRLLEFLLVAAAVAMGLGPIGAVCGFLAGRLAILIVMRWRLLRVAPWLRYGMSGFDRATVRALFGPAMGFTGYTIGNALNIQGPILVIGAVFGSTAVVPFATLRTLTRILPQLLLVLTNIVRPEIGIAVGRDDFALVRRLNRLLCRLALWAVLVIAIGLALFGDVVVTLWTGGHVAVSEPLFALLLGVVTINALWSTNAQTLRAINRVQGQAVVYLLANGLALATMAVVGTALGLAGPAGVLLVAECVMLVYVVTRTLAYLGEAPGPFLKSLLVPPFDVVAHLRARQG